MSYVVATKVSCRFSRGPEYVSSNLNIYVCGQIVNMCDSATHIGNFILSTYWKSIIKSATSYSSKCFIIFMSYAVKPSKVSNLNNNGSSVYMCMLDACKAFDRVNLLTLFKTLHSTGMCPIYLRPLMKIYEEQKMRIRWNTTVTDYFTISNGVKQGGVLSPILFSLYLDQLISRLRHSGMGFHMNGLFTGVFIDADDITLQAPSRASLALMLEQCESFSRTHDI